MADIESLQFNIQSDSSQAVQGIDNLRESLERLQAVTKNGAGLGKVATNLSNLNVALSKVDAGSAERVRSLASGISALTSVKSGSSNTVAKNFAALSTALKGLSAADAAKLSGIANGIRSLNAVDTSGLRKLNTLPKAISSLNTADLTQLKTQINGITAALGPLQKQINSMTPGLNSAATVMSKFKGTVGSASKATSQQAVTLGALGSGFAGALAKLSMFLFGFNLLKSATANAIMQSNKYQEDLNLFNVAMGDSAAAAQNFAETVSALVGIDPAEWMRNQGVFNTLLTGFGVASEKASVMSKNLTQLGYDLSSFFNIPIEESLTKIQSGISGELEPLRRLGYDLSEARLKQEAYKLGIDESVKSMTQAEKAQLRYYAIMTQVTTAQGDMARTIQAPANQLRVLQAQATMCARAIGNIFIPILNAVLPVCIRVVKGVRMVAQAIASLFGFKLTEVNYDGVKSMKALGSSAGSAGTSLGNAGNAAGNAAGSTKKLTGATKKAGKAIKAQTKTVHKYEKQLASFDKLNVLKATKTTKTKSGKSPTGSAGTGGAGSSGIGGGGGIGTDGLDIPMPTYDFLGDLDKHISKTRGLIEKFFGFISKHIKGVLTGLGAIVAGVAAFKITKNWLLFLDMLKRIGITLKQASGIFLLVSGTVLVVAGAFDALKHGLTDGNLTQMLIGISAATLGLYMTFGKSASAIGLVVGGILLLTIGIRDAMKNGFNRKNLIAIAGGIAAISAALYMMKANPVILIAGAVAMLATVIFANRKKIKKWLSKHPALDALVKFVIGVPEKIAKVIGKIIGFFKKVGSAGDKLKDKLKGIFDFSLSGSGIGKLASGITMPLTFIPRMSISIVKLIKEWRDKRRKGDTTLGFAAYMRQKISAFIAKWKGRMSQNDKLMRFKSVMTERAVSFVRNWLKNASSRHRTILFIPKIIETIKSFLAKWKKGGSRKDNTIEVNAKTDTKKSKLSIFGWLRKLKPKETTIKFSGRIATKPKPMIKAWSKSSSTKDRTMSFYGKMKTRVKTLVSKWTASAGQKDRTMSFYGRMSTRVKTLVTNWTKGSQAKDRTMSFYGRMSTRIKTLVTNWTHKSAKKDRTLNFFGRMITSAKRLVGGFIATVAKKKRYFTFYGKFSTNPKRLVSSFMSKPKRRARTFSVYASMQSSASKMLRSFKRKWGSPTLPAYVSLHKKNGTKLTFNAKNKKGGKIELYKSGGMPTTGQMFIARENGPEMVGTMGAKTTVANNDQIVEGIAAGVAAAMAGTNGLLAQLVSSVNSGSQTEAALEIDNVEFGRLIIRAINQMQRQDGNMILNL